MLKGFRNFLMRGDVIVSTQWGWLLPSHSATWSKVFTDEIINPLIAAAQGHVQGPGFGWQLIHGGDNGTYLNIGAFISAIIYFVIYMAVVYFMIVMPYKLCHGSTGQNGVRRSTSD